MIQNNNITSKQMMRITFVCQTGIGVISLPALLANEVGHDGWISVLATGILAIFLSSLIAVLLRRYSNKCIYDITRLLFGNVTGLIINSLFVIYLIFAAASGITVFLFYLKITLFPQTPSIVMSLIILIPTIYMVWQGLKTVARFKLVTMIAYVVMILYILLIIKEMKLSFLQPVGEAGILPLVSSMKTSFFAYIGMELIAVFYSEISDKENALKYHVYANLFSMLFVIITVVACTATFGEKFLAVLNIPLFNLSRVYHAPIIERVDLYVISIWFIAMGCSIRAYFMAAYYSIQKVFKLKKSRILYGIFVCTIILFTVIPGEISKAYVLLEIVNYAGIGVIALLILCLALSMVNKNGVAENE